MKNNPIDRLKDPFYAQLIHAVEELIGKADEEAEKEGIRLNDSHIKSSLNKVRKRLRGEKTMIPKNNPREDLMADLIDSLVVAPRQLFIREAGEGASAEEMPLDPIEFVRAIETVEDSMEVHKINVPGSRGYLDFLRNFLREAEIRQARA